MYPKQRIFNVSQTENIQCIPNREYSMYPKQRITNRPNNIKSIQ